MTLTNAQRAVWLVQGKVSCPDIAALWNVKIGAPEFRLLDHPCEPNFSCDFPSKLEAMAWADETGAFIIDLTCTGGF
jgi:hypothetical protein